jgi:hypothetical protein
MNSHPEEIVFVHVYIYATRQRYGTDGVTELASSFYTMSTTSWRAHIAGDESGSRQRSVF